MTLFIWVDENGKWRVTHLLPTGEVGARIVCVGGPPIFFDDEGNEIEVEVGR